MENHLKVTGFIHRPQLAKIKAHNGPVSFVNCLGGDATLLPELMDLWKQRCYVSGVISSLAVAVVLRFKDIIIKGPCSFIPHIPVSEGQVNYGLFEIYCAQLSQRSMYSKSQWSELLLSSQSYTLTLDKAEVCRVFGVCDP